MYSFPDYPEVKKIDWPLGKKKKKILISSLKKNLQRIYGSLVTGQRLYTWSDLLIYWRGRESTAI